MIAMVYDCTLKRPACVLIQAAMGGSTTELHKFFPWAEWWLTDITPDMRLIEGTEAEWNQASKITEHEMGKP